jgi:hypothetical protein
MQLPCSAQLLRSHKGVEAVGQSVSVQQLSYGGATGHLVEQRRTRWDSGIGYEDRDIFEAFLKLPVPQRKLIRELILTFAKVHGETPTPD